MARLAGLIGIAVWIGGIVIAKGFWMTLAAFFIPFVSWYLVMERVIERYL